MPAFLQSLFDYLGQWKPVPAILRAYLADHVHYKHLRPAEILLQRGQLCPAIYFVARGCIVWYTDKGTPCFFTPDGKILIKKSYDERRPSAYTLLAITDTDLLFLNYEEVTQMGTAFDIIHYYGNLARMEQFGRLRDISQLRGLATAAERYDALGTLLDGTPDRLPCSLFCEIAHIGRATYFSLRQQRAHGK